MKVLPVKRELWKFLIISITIADGHSVIVRFLHNAYFSNIEAGVIVTNLLNSSGTKLRLVPELLSPKNSCS